MVMSVLEGPFRLRIMKALMSVAIVMSVSKQNGATKKPKNVV